MGLSSIPLSAHEKMSLYRWKTFDENEDRPEKPRRYGVTEMRGPHYTLLNQNVLQECKNLGFDTIELNVGSLGVPEETLLRYVRLIKSGGLRAKPHFAVKFNKSDIPISGDRAFGAYVVPRPRSSELVVDVDLFIRRAERCIEAGADMIMIDADDVCKHADSVRADIIAKLIGRLGLQKTMFEASHPRTSEWFIRQYSPNVNLFVDHSHVMDLECLRGRKLGKNHASVLGPSYFLF